MTRLYSILISFLPALMLYGQRYENTVFSDTRYASADNNSGRECAMADSIFTRTFLRLSLLSNYDSASIAGYDKILTYSHQVYIVRIQNITPSLVLFLYPFNTDFHSLNRDEISQIQYANGTIDIFLPLRDKTGFDDEIVDTFRIIIRNRRDWEKVTLTDKPEEIAGMIEKGKITAHYIADFVNAENEYLEKNARIIIRKKAANLNTPVVLLVTRNYHKAYGDLPSIELEGVLYSYE